MAHVVECLASEGRDRSHGNRYREFTAAELRGLSPGCHDRGRPGPTPDRKLTSLVVTSVGAAFPPRSGHRKRSTTTR